MYYENLGLLYAFNSYEYDSNVDYHFSHIAEWYYMKLLAQYGVV